MAKDCKQNTLHSGQTCAPVKVPSNAEATALHEMRRIKDRVRVLKRRISGLDNSGSGEDPEASIAPLEAELAILKNEWKDWEAKRKKAAHERMVLLGHAKD